MSKQLAGKLTERSYLLRQKCESKDKVVVERLGISYSEFKLLNLYTSKKQYTVKDLANLLQITSGAITQIVTNLEKKELVERSIAPDDRRNILVSLTDMGEQMVQKIETELNAIHEEILEKLNENEKIQLVKAIEMYIQILSEWLDTKMSEMQE